MRQSLAMELMLMRSLRKVGVFMVLTIVSLMFTGCRHIAANSQPSDASPAIVTASPVDSPAPASATVASADSEIWAQIRQGQGYVLLFRHALAPGTGDPANFRLDDCSTQRNLSEAGRQQATRMGEVLRQQQIAVARVLSSQWCRCLDTAQLMNIGKVEPFPVLNSFFQDRSTEQTQTDQLRQFILDNHDNPGVVVMVTHQVNITAISSIVPESGAAVVMRAVSPEQLEFVGQLDPL